MKRLVLSPPAQRDLEQQLSYLRERSPKAARAFRQRIQQALRSLAAGAFEGSSTQLTSGTEVRRWPVEDRVIYYRHEGDVLQVLRIYPARSDSLEE